MSAILKITDGTTSVSLIRGPIYLESWLPSIPDYKGGGVYADSPIGESRRLVYKQLESVTDAFSIKIANKTQDDTIRTLRTLQNLLESAANYWINPYANTPVYIVAKASRESSARYATIIRGRIPNVGPVMAQPFTNCADPVLDNMTLTVEHHPWEGAVPGSSGEDITLGVDAPNHNIVGNESFETNASHLPTWSETGGPSTAEYSKTRSYREEGSFYVVAAGAGEGIQQTIVDAERDATYTFSAWVYVESGVVAVELSTDATFANLGSTLSTVTGEWEQLSITHTLNALSQVSIRSSGSGATFYVDQAELFVQSGMANAAIPDSTTQLVSNAQKHQVINYIYTYNDGAWSNNLLYEASPQAITGINDDEATYFGITGGDDTFPSPHDWMGNGGPFNNLVFNISSVIGGTSPTFLWEYWRNSVVWTVLPEVDRTQAFSVAGTNSVSWENPQAQFEPQSLQTTLSVGEGSGAAGVPLEKAYWVRIRKTGGTMVDGDRPQISTPFPYTTTWPYVDLGTVASPIGGDFTARGKISVKNKSGEAETVISLEVADQESDTFFDTAVGTNEFAATVINLGWQYSAGLRFQGLAIGENSQILSAKIRLVATSAATGTPTSISRLRIRAEDILNSPSLETYNLAQWLALDRTTEEILWHITGETAAGNVHRTPDISNVFQEIVDLGFQSGSDITIFIEDEISDGTSSYAFASFDNVTYDAPTLEITWQDKQGGVWINRIVAGVRDKSRGTNFVSHINMSDWQKQPGIDIAVNKTAFFQDRGIAAGNRLIIVETVAGESMPWPVPSPYVPAEDKDYNIIVTLDSLLAQEYIGEYRAFLRVSGTLQSGETADFALALRTGSSGITKFGFTSAEFRFAHPTDGARSHFDSLLPVDLGLISVPQNPIGEYDKISFLIAAAASVPGRTLRIHDLILIPSDEWIGDVKTEDGIQNAIIGNETAVLDSVSNQKRPINAYHLSASGSLKAILTAFSQEVVLSQNKSQRMYFLFYTVDRDQSDSQFGERSSPWALAEISVSAQKKYLSLRGGG